MKENDYLLNMLSNPDFNESDFKAVGLTTENTSIEKNRDVYKNLDFVKNNPMLQTDGKFDEVKFNRAYDIALQSFNNFAQGITSDIIGKEHNFYRNDIYAKYEDRNNNIEAYIQREANPLREGRGLIHANDVMESPYSVREIAQTQKVWDGATQSWLDAPNDSFFNNFFDTLVLAQWDEDGEHKDPITGQIVKHKAGEKKLNENGTYYYETLNGRSIYGRDVLSKFDTLTVDGSFVNKFDFFDSDDKKKSVGGTLVRNAIKVIPAFIPYVAPVYFGMRVGLNVVDLMGKFGKVFTGSDSPTLSSLEGFSKSLSFSSSDYAQGSSEAAIPSHAWSMENLLNLGADTFTQLAEQRWIFKFVPALVKGRAGIDNKFGQKGAKKLEIEAWKKANPLKSLKERMELINKSSGKTMLESETAAARVVGDYEALSKRIGEDALASYMKEYRELGKVISQAYMTGITVADAYGEAKMEGASDMEAALLTIGYAIGEYKLLNSDLGQWILPELKADKRRFKEVAKTMWGVKKPGVSASPQEKMNWVSKIVGLGKKAADGLYNNSKLLPSIAGGALAEGVEEVSEELLYDVSKSLFNVVNYIRGDETNLTAFNDVANRYALSFVGGAFGGAIAGVESGYREGKTTKPLKDKDAAFLELVHIVKEGKATEFLSTVDKMTWNSKDLSAVESQDTFGETSYLPGTTKDNQDQAIKQAFRELVAIIEKILNANGASVDDESLLGILTNAKDDLRYMALLKSTFAGQYLLEFNNISTEIVSLVQQLNESVTDEQAKSEEYKQKLTDLKIKLKQKLAEKDSYLKGERSGEFIEKALFEMTEDISSIFMDVNKIQFIESLEGKKINEISEDRLKKLEEKWNEFSEYNRKDKLEMAFRIFKAANITASEMLKAYNNNYFDPNKNEDNVIATIQNLFGARMATYTALNIQGEYLIPDNAVIELSNEGSGDLYNINNSTHAVVAHSLVSKLEKIDYEKYVRYSELLRHLTQLLNEDQKETNLKQEEGIIDVLSELLQEEDLVQSIIEDIQNIPYLNFATKNQLKNAFTIAQKYLYINDVEIDEVAEANAQKILTEIDAKPYSPVLELINSWSLSMKNTDMNVEQLLKTLHTQYEILSAQNTLDQFSIQEDNAKRISTALKNIKLLKATILAARTDGVNGANRVGYNVTANEVLQQELAEIDKNDANVLLQDINKVEEKLHYFLRLHGINTGQKLKEHLKVSVNKDIITFNKIKKLVLEDDWPPKDWAGKAELKAALSDSFEIVDQINNDDVEKRRLVLNDSEKVSLKRDMQKIDKAIHEFFKANEDKLSDIDQLANLLSSNLFGFHELDDTLLDTRTKELSDTLFVWWLATRAALNPDDFYKTYKDNLISGVAPIPAQEQAIMTAVAGVLNGQVFHNFAKAYNKSLEQKTKDLDESYFAGIKNKRNYMQSDYMDSDRAIQFFRHILIEGVAGSGKSTAVAKSIVNLLRQSDKGQELLNNIWFVHASKAQALTMAKELGLGDNYKHAYSREEYLEKISPGVTNLRKINDNGELELDKDDLVQRPDETLYRYKADINKGYTKEPPSLIIFDEVTGFSQQDMLLSEDFANHYGIMNLAFGDFVQDGLTGILNLDENTFLNSEIFRGNFITPIKLGDSLRTANGVKDINNKKLQALIYELLNNGKINNALDLKWYTDGTKQNGYQDATIILGDKVYTRDIDKYLEQIKSDIDVLLKQLPDKEKLEDHEKLGFIYDDTNSPIYQYLKQLNSAGKYKDKILMKEGSSSQGMEADFYVIDLNNMNHSNERATRKHHRRVYTGLTRAKKASIAILRNTTAINENHNLDPEEAPGEFSLSLTGIEDFSLSIKHIYDNVYSEGSQLQYKRFGEGVNKKSKFIINGSEYEYTDRPETVNIDTGTSFVYESDNYTLRGYVKSNDGRTHIWATTENGDMVWELSDFINNIVPKIKTAVNTQITTELEKIDEFNIDKIDIKNDKDSELNMLLHSFATNETGLIEERTRTASGNVSVKYKVGIGFEETTDKDGKRINGRVDGMNGLIKLLGINVENGYINPKDYLTLLSILDRIRSAALYETTQQDIIELLASAISAGGKTIDKRGLSTRLVFKSSLMPDKNEEGSFEKLKPWHKFFKSIKEKVRGLFVNEGEHVIPTQKHLSMIITRKDGNKETAVLEIPLVNFTNPLTMIHSEGFSDIKKVVDNIKKDGTKKSSVEILKKTIEELEKNPVKMSTAFIKLSKMYLEINDGKVVLLDDLLKQKGLVEDGKVTLQNLFTSTGPLMTSTEKGTGEGRHAEYYDRDLSYSGKWMDLTKYRLDSGKVVSDIFVIGSELKGSGIKVGHPFVLISDAKHKFTTNSDTELIEYYKKLLKDPNIPKLVKLVYVSPPTVSVAEYFKNIDAIYRKSEDDIDVTIGSELTSFNLLAMIMEKGVLENKDLLNEAFYNNEKSGYRKLKNLVLALKTLQDEVSPSEFIEILNGNGELSKISSYKDVNLQSFYKTIFGEDATTNMLSWKSFLQSLLRWYVMSEYVGGKIKKIENFNDSTLIQVQRINAITEMLAREYNINGIFRSPQFDTSITDRTVSGDFKRIANDNGAFKGKSYTINGKIDSTAFKGNVLPIVDIILESLIKSSDSLSQIEKDTITYQHDNYGIFALLKNQDVQARREAVDNFMKEVVINDSDLNTEIRKKVNKLYKNNINISTENIIQELSKSFLIKQNDKDQYVIIKKDENIELTDDPDIVNYNGEKHRISVIYNESSNKYEIILTPEKTNESENGLTIKDIKDKKDFIDFINHFLDEANEWSDGDIYISNEFEYEDDQLIDSILSLSLSNKILIESINEKFIETYISNTESKKLDNTKNMIKIFMKYAKQQDEQSCAIKIN